MLLLRALPDDEWRRLRLLVFVLGSVGLVLAASGVLVTKVFHQPSTIKYTVTVIGFGLIVFMATVRAPLRWLVGMAILVAPIDSVITVQGAQLTPLLAVDVLGALVALPRFGTGRTALGPMVAVFPLLLLPGIAQAASPGGWIVWAAVTLTTGWLAFEVAREPGGVRFVVTMLVVSALIQAVIAIWESKTKHQIYLYGNSGTVAVAGEDFFQYGNLIRPEGTLPDPIGLGQFLALCLPLIIVYAASMKRYLFTFGVVCVAGVVALALSLSLSRMSIVGGGVGLLLTLLLIPGRRRWRAFVAVAAVGGLVTVLVLSLGGKSLTARFSSILNPTAAHVSTAAGDLQREQIWHAALRIAEAHALTGVGLGNVTSYLPKYGVPVTGAANAQNTPLQFFAEGGILGLVAVLAVVLAAFTDLAHGFRGERLWAAGCFGALIATLITWSTDVEVRYVQISGTVAILMGLIAAIRLTAVRQRQPGLEPAS